MDFFNKNIISKNQQISLPILQEKEVELWVKREDLIHKDVSGNKFRKLKYNILEAISQEKKTILTFGGAYSNHVLATAVAGKLSGIKTIGVIRGNELADRLQDVLKENHTLRTAYDNGMQFKFVSREIYREKRNAGFVKKLHDEFGDFYLVPEGGTNKLAIKGCEEILTSTEEKFNYICTAVGTGGTISGLINSLENNQHVIGFSALKGDFLLNEIKQNVQQIVNWQLNVDYHFGGYAKYNEYLISFINKFYKETNILLDPIYTGKMIFGIIDLITKGKFCRGTKILAIHTGGLQGVEGFNKRLKNKGIEEIIHNEN